jgi:hypothetical protein
MTEKTVLSLYVFSSHTILCIADHFFDQTQGDDDLELSSSLSPPLKNVKGQVRPRPLPRTSRSLFSSHLHAGYR